MRIGLIAPPFIPIPPKLYGGTELFVAHLARGLKDFGHEVVVYGNGESSIDANVRWLYPNEDWPVCGNATDSLKELNHSAWAIADASKSCDLVHVNSACALPCSR